MQPIRRTTTLATPDATADLAQSIGSTLGAGDVILLEGSIGAGKTHFARALIQGILAVPEDVPSPTFTLVQVYDTVQGELWHADLYRLTSTFELEELGLSQAFCDSICLIEWPDRLASDAPDSALWLSFSDGRDDQARLCTATWSDPRWTSRLKGLLHD